MVKSWRLNIHVLFVNVGVCRCMCVILCKGLLDIHYVRLVDDDIKGDGYWNVSRNVNFRLLDFIGLSWNGIKFFHPLNFFAGKNFTDFFFKS